MYCSFQPTDIEGFQSKCVKLRCESVKLRSKCINCVKFCILLQRIYATMGKNSDSGAGRFDCICLRKKGKATRGGCNYCGGGNPGRRRHGSARWKSPINSSPPLFPQSPRVFNLSVELLLFTLWADPKDPVNTYFFSVICTFCDLSDQGHCYIWEN